MKKQILNLAICAGLGLYSINALATVDYSTGGTANSVGFASNVSSTTLTNSGSILDVKFDIGKGVNDGVERYMRIDLHGAEGTEWGTTLNDSDLTALASAGGTPVISIAQGGTGSDTYVIYLVKPVGAAFAATDELSFNPGVITSGDTSGLNFSYRMYESITAAANPDNTASLKLAELSNKAYVRFLKPYKLTLTSTPLTADVATGFTEFTGTTVAKTGELVAITIAADTNLMTAGGGSISTLSDVIGDSDLIFKGDFLMNFSQDMTDDTQETAALERVFLSDSACTTAFSSDRATDAFAEDGSTATFNLTTASDMTSATYSKSFCLTANTGSDTGNITGEIPEQLYTVDFVTTAATNMSTYDYLNGSAGKILHNGAQLITPFFT
ncbi:hypothetical protein, partial [Candidatus Venteria ishoeyi]|uniref:hypothetical protein n=1 Tax=Candidatus Venteria ishoeyi TaxID=1899563 RepID=UPI0011B086D6